MNDRDLSRNLTDLAGTVADQPQLLASVHRRVRHLRRRRVALQGTAVTGVLVLAGAAYRAVPTVEVGSTGSPGTTPGTTIPDCPGVDVPPPGPMAVTYATNEAVVARSPIGDELVLLVSFPDGEWPPLAADGPGTGATFVPLASPLPAPPFRTQERTFTITANTKFFENREEVPRRTLVEGQRIVIEAYRHGNEPWWIARLGLNPDVDVSVAGGRGSCIGGRTTPPGTVDR